MGAGRRERVPDRAGRHREVASLLAFGSAEVDAGLRVRYLTAADLVDTLYRGLADNTVGKVIDSLLRNELIIFDLCRHRDYAEVAGVGLVTRDRALRSRHSYRLSRKARILSGGR